MPLKTAEEDKKQEASTSLAAAIELSLDAVVSEKEVFLQ